MYSKLKNSYIYIKTDSNDYIKDINTREIYDFIIKPMKDEYAIKHDNFNKGDFTEIIFRKT